MSSDHQAYLAAKYMSGPKADAILAATKGGGGKKGKKHRRKLEPIEQGTPVASSGFILRDEDNDGWEEGPDEDDSAPLLEEIATFKGKNSRESKWSVIQPARRTLTPEAVELPPEPADEQPLIVSSTSDTVQGGLQTAAQIRQQVSLKNPKPGTSCEDAEEETIYRDSQGRKIDTKQQRAEEKRRQAKELEKQMKKMQWGKGLVQREDKKADAAELSRIALQPFARTIDDKELNDDLKEKQRWNDPAAAFLTKSTKSDRRTDRPKYTGPPPPPNRYGIQPGFRWDGVDRSNGFESKLFQTGNEHKRNRAEAYNYSVDEM